MSGFRPFPFANEQSKFWAMIRIMGPKSSAPQGAAGPSLLTVLHLCADLRKARLIRQFAEEEKVGLVLLFGDVSGPVLSNLEQVLYRQAMELFQDAHGVPERIEIARAFLARKGVTEAYREALQFYLDEVATLDGDRQVIWKGAFLRAIFRLEKVAEVFSGLPHAVLADSAACEAPFEKVLLDYRALRLGSLTLKGIGLSPAEGIRVPMRNAPEEYRHELPHAVALKPYLETFDIFVANAFSANLQEALRGLRNRLVIVPGAATEVSPLKGLTLAFEGPGTFSLYKPKSERMLRQVYTFVGNDIRLVRIDELGARFKHERTESHLDRPLRRAAR